MKSSTFSCLLDVAIMVYVRFQGLRLWEHLDTNALSAVLDHEKLHVLGVDDEMLDVFND